MKEGFEAHVNVLPQNWETEVQAQVYVTLMPNSVYQVMLSFTSALPGTVPVYACHPVIITSRSSLGSKIFFWKIYYIWSHTISWPFSEGFNIKLFN